MGERRSTRAAWMPPGLRLPPRADPDYWRRYHRARYEHDPAYRAGERDRQQARHRGIARENAEGERWRAVRARRSIDRLTAAGWSYARIGRALGVGKQAVYCWAAGRRLPREANAARLGRLADAVAARMKGDVS